MKYRGVFESSQSGVSYYLGIRDPQSGKMQVMDTARVNMFPVWKNDAISISATPLPNADKVARTYQEKMDSLTKEFGSLKKKRNLESRKKLKVSFHCYMDLN